MKFYTGVLSIAAMLLAGACGSDYYSMEDFSSVKKIDTHVHLNGESPALAELAKEDNFRVITVNVDVPRETLDNQKKFALHQISQFPDQVDFLTAFTLVDWDSANWSKQIIEQLASDFAEGALGIKLWKNIGMVYKDSANQFIMVDNPAFDPIIAYVIQQDKTVFAHIGEPKNCWLPLDQMTVNNDREYFKNHPEYHMFLHPENPSYEDIINARDRFVEKHPDMRFVGAHLGSLEWDVDELAKRLDRFPNMAVDVAARIPHLQYQSKSNREKVRSFLIKYQDRIIYATDGGISTSSIPENAKRDMHETWMEDWKYFVTDETMTVDEVDDEFQGLKLPREVVDKLYRNNAVKWFKMKE